MRVFGSILLFLISFILTFTGMFIAGYMGLYEVLIEFFFIMWTVTFITKTVTEIRSGQEAAPKKPFLLSAWKWFSTFKSRKVEQVLNGERIRPFFEVIILGLCIGWSATLISIFFKDWHYVLSREMKETVLDILISISLISFVVHMLSDDYHTKNDDTEERYHPLDPEAHDHIKQWGEAQASISVFWNAAISFLLKSNFIAIFGIICFIIGWYLHSREAIPFLDYAADWQLPQ